MLVRLVTSVNKVTLSERGFLKVTLGMKGAWRAKVSSAWVVEAVYLGYYSNNLDCEVLSEAR